MSILSIVKVRNIFVISAHFAEFYCGSFWFVLDVIFFIFLYQKWIYPVDHRRINEYGTSGEIEEKIKQGLSPGDDSADNISNGTAASAKESAIEDKKNL